MKSNKLLLLTFICLISFTGCNNGKGKEMTSEELKNAILNIDSSLDKNVKKIVCDETLNYRVNISCYKNHEEDYFNANGRYPIDDDAMTESVSTTKIYDNYVYDTLNVSYDTQYKEGAENVKSADTERQIYLKSDNSIYWVIHDNLDETKSFGDALYKSGEEKNYGYDSMKDMMLTQCFEAIGQNTQVSYFFQSYMDEYEDDFKISGTRYSSKKFHLEGTLVTDTILYYLPVVWPSEDMFPVFDVVVRMEIVLKADFDKNGYCTSFYHSEQWYMPYSPFDGTCFDEEQYLYGTVFNYHDVSIKKQGNFSGTLFDYGNI